MVRTISKHTAAKTYTTKPIRSSVTSLENLEINVAPRDPCILRMVDSHALSTFSENFSKLSNYPLDDFRGEPGLQNHPHYEHTGLAPPHSRNTPERYLFLDLKTWSNISHQKTLFGTQRMLPSKYLHEHYIALNIESIRGNRKL